MIRGSPGGELILPFRPVPPVPVNRAFTLQQRVQLPHLRYSESILKLDGVSAIDYLIKAGTAVALAK